MNKAKTLSLLLLCTFVVGAAAEAKITNLCEFDPGIWRGRAPNKDDMVFLKKKGIKTVIDLRDEEHFTEKEGAQAKALGMQYINIPMHRTRYVEKASLDKFMSVLKNPANKPVFVHCQGGQDRTGVMLGMYRMETSNWDHDKVYDEMLKHGFHKGFYKLKMSLYGHERPTSTVADGN